MSLLKQLIKEVERLKKKSKYFHVDLKIQGIRQTVESVENWLQGDYIIDENSKDWEKLKKLLGVK